MINNVLDVSIQKSLRYIRDKKIVTINHYRMVTPYYWDQTIHPIFSSEERTVNRKFKNKEHL